MSMSMRIDRNCILLLLLLLLAIITNRRQCSSTSNAFITWWGTRSVIYQVTYDPMSKTNHEERYIAAEGVKLTGCGFGITIYLYLTVSSGHSKSNTTNPMGLSMELTMSRPPTMYSYSASCRGHVSLSKESLFSIAVG